MYFPSVREYRKIDEIYLSGIVGNVLYIYYNVYTSFGENLGEKFIYIAKREMRFCNATVDQVQVFFSLSINL